MKLNPMYYSMNAACLFHFFSSLASWKRVQAVPFLKELRARINVVWKRTFLIPRYTAFNSLYFVTTATTTTIVKLTLSVVLGGGGREREEKFELALADCSA